MKELGEIMIEVNLELIQKLIKEKREKILQFSNIKNNSIICNFITVNKLFCQ